MVDAPLILPGFLVVAQCLLNALDVKTIVIREKLILCCHYRQPGIGRNIFKAYMITMKALTLEDTADLRERDGRTHKAQDDQVRKV